MTAINFFKNSVDVTGRDVGNEEHRRRVRCLEWFEWLFDFMEPEHTSLFTTTTTATTTTTGKTVTTQSAETTSYVVLLVTWVTYIVFERNFV
jgi:hypothetical protein